MSTASNFIGRFALPGSSRGIRAEVVNIFL